MAKGLSLSSDEVGERGGEGERERSGEETMGGATS
jgi:hypothetical protein